MGKNVQLKVSMKQRNQIHVTLDRYFIQFKKEKWFSEKLSD